MESVRRGRGLHPEFEAEMRAQNVPAWYIDSCKKIKYMFPKAHAAAYVLMALRIAYFKVHHPILYYSTYFTVRAADFDLLTMTKGSARFVHISRKSMQKDLKHHRKRETCLRFLRLRLKCVNVVFHLRNRICINPMQQHLLLMETH